MKNAKSDIVFGYHSLMETIRSGKTVEKVIVQKGGEAERKEELLDLLREHQIPWQNVPLEKLNRITRKNHQGVIGFISPIEFSNLENLVQTLFEEGKNPLIVLLDQVTDVRNFGAICRSAECMGVHAIVVPYKGSARIGADAMKTSAGALSRIPICRVHTLPNAARYLQNSGFQTVGCTEKGDRSLSSIEMTGPTALVMGSEEEGISKAVMDKCHALGKIEMAGEIGSLNVSVASGIALYEISKQREQAS